MVLEELKSVPWVENDAARARVKIEALRSYLELRWPHLYGKRLDITVKSLDMREALELARQRAAVRVQPVDNQGDNRALSTDSQSVDTPCQAEIEAAELSALLE